MIVKHQKALAATGIVVAMLLSACSSNGSKLSDVDYSMNDATAEPSISMETPFISKETQTHVINEGTGDSISEGDELVIDATIFSGEDAKSQQTSYPSSPLMIPVSKDLKDNAPDLYDMLTGHKVGTSFSYSTNMVKSGPTASPSPLGEDNPTNIEVYTVQQKLLKEAQGKELPKDQVNKALESFNISDQDGSATIKLSKDRGDAPKKLVSQSLIEGEGKKVSENDNVYVRYQGVQWSDGKAFDGNFGDKGNTASFPLGGVIKGWTEGLKDKPVGSRVLLLVPADQAYGEKPSQQGQPAGALVFVVDILGATPGQAMPKDATHGQMKKPEDPSASAQPSQK